MDLLDNMNPKEIRAFYEDTIDHRVRCDDTCTFFHMCPLKISSRNVRNCRAQTLDPEETMRLINLFFMGDTGIQEEILRSVFHLSRALDLKDDAKSILTYIEVLIKVSKLGKKDTGQTQKPDMGITITTVDGLQKNTPCLVLPGADSESLYDSPIVDEIMTDYRNRDD